MAVDISVPASVKQEYISLSDRVIRKIIQNNVHKSLNMIFFFFFFVSKKIKTQNGKSSGLDYKILIKQ